MQEQDWALLGLEPTKDLAAIKKAYALKLRVTRPDDDAEAYQALRSAYERVQQWAKWSSEEAPAPEAPTEVPTERLETPAPAPSEDLALTAPRADPVTLVEQAETVWNEHGHEAFVAHWPYLREQLEALPLSAAASASQAFADWTLRHPAMPGAMLAHLETYFGWRDDYRGEQQLGPELAQALHALLDDVRPRLLNDPELLSQAAPLFSLDALNARPRTRWKAWLAGAASAQTLARIKAGMGEHLLTRLGLQPTAQKGLDFLLLSGLTLRWAPLLLAITVALSWTSADLWSASTAAVAVALSVMAWRGVSGLLGACLRDGLKTLDRAGRDEPPPGTPQHNRTPIGMGLFAVGALFGVFAGTWPPPIGDAWGFLCIAAGLLVGQWTLTDDRGRALAASLIAALFFFHALFGQLLAPSTWAGLACLWTCMSGLAFEGRLPTQLVPPVRFIGRPIANTLTVADHWGSSLACWVPLLVVLASFALDGPRHGLIAWAGWSLAGFALTRAQAAIDAAVLRWLASTSRES